MKADSFRRVEVITGVGRRRRWTDEEKAWIVAEVRGRRQCLNAMPVRRRLP